MKGDKSRERAAKQAAREHAERRTSNCLLAGVAALMVVGVVADGFFIRWQRQQRHLRHEQRQSRTNESHAGVPPDGTLSIEPKP